MSEAGETPVGEMAATAVPAAAAHVDQGPTTAEPDIPPSRPWLSGPAGKTVARLAGLVLVLAISITVVLQRDRLVGLRAFGYPGLFLVSLIANATVVLPAPSLALVFAAGSSLSPLLIGLSAGSGEALGELTGYLAGVSGRGIVENGEHYARVQRWMHRFGLWVIFGLSLVPNPFFDLAGITAGSLRVPVHRFLLACWLGKVIKTTYVAFAGSQAIQVIERMLTP